MMLERRAYLVRAAILIVDVNRGLRFRSAWANDKAVCPIGLNGSEAPAWECGFRSSCFPLHGKLELGGRGVPKPMLLN